MKAAENYSDERNWRVFSYVILIMTFVCLIYVCYGYSCKKYREVKLQEARDREEVTR